LSHTKKNIFSERGEPARGMTESTPILEGGTNPKLRKRGKGSWIKTGNEETPGRNGNEKGRRCSIKIRELRRNASSWPWGGKAPEEKI